MKELDLFTNLELENIYENIASEWQLKEAFRNVKANKGNPGVDGQSIKEFEEKLAEEIHTYLDIDEADVLHLLGFSE